jgi:hypothetical protein
MNIPNNKNLLWIAAVLTEADYHTGSKMQTEVYNGPRPHSILKPQSGGNDVALIFNHFFKPGCTHCTVMQLM